MKRARLKTIAWVTLVVVAAAWLLPLLVRVNFWKSEIAAALSGQLRRPVAIGDIHVQIIGGLGVDIDHVSIAEDPAFGSEPFARIDSLEAHLAASSIWHGQMEFSSLAVSGASFNIVRNAAGNWNLASIGEPPNSLPPGMSAGVLSQESASPLLPNIQIDSGRINFKSEDRKHAWCLENVSLDLSPPTAPRRPWRFELSALPTRTDIPFHATNPFRAQGEFGPFSSAMQSETGVPLRIDWSAENAMLVEMLTIAAGRDLGVHGTMNVHGHMAGTTSLLRFTAESEIKDLHRWDLFPNPAAPSLRAQLKGIVDLAGGSLELSAFSLPIGSGEVAARGRADDLFAHARMSIDAELRQVPLDSLAELAPQFTARLDRAASAEGTLGGTLHADGLQASELFAPRIENGVQASIEVSAGSFRPAKSAPPLHFAAFDASFGSGNIRLGPLRITPDQSGPVELAADLDAGKRTSHWRISGDRIELSALERVIKSFGIAWSAAELAEGTAAMKLDIVTAADTRPQVTGSGQILGAVVNVRGMAEPLRIQSAKLLFGRIDVKVQPISIELGSTDLGGAMTIKLPENRPAASGATVAPFDLHDLDLEFHLDSPLLDLQALEGLFSAPPPKTSFFSFGGSDSRAPGVNSAVDNKLLEIVDAVPVTGTLQAERFRYHDVAMENLKASVRYEDRKIEIPEFAAEHSGGTERGTAMVSFGPGPFSFAVESRFANVDMGGLIGKLNAWKGLLAGRVSGSLKLESSGRSLDEVVSQLSGSVEAAGRDVVIRGSEWTEALGEGGAQTHIGSFTSTAEIGQRQIRIGEMKLIPARRPRTETNRALNPEAWLVSGEVGFDRSLHLTVQQDPEGSKSIWAGTLAEPRASSNVSSVTSNATSSAIGGRGNASRLAR